MTAVHSAHIAEYASVQKCMLLLLSRFLSLFLFHVKTLRGRLSKISFEQNSSAILLIKREVDRKWAGPEIWCWEGATWRQGSRHN